jgi:hypothetical protein
VPNANSKLQGMCARVLGSLAVENKRLPKYLRNLDG